MNSNTPPGQFAITSNTKLAATLRVFEIPLPIHNPAVVAEVYKLSDLRRGWKNPKPPIRVFWNFEPHAAAASVIQGYNSFTAEDEFSAFVATLQLPPDKEAKLLALHSASTAQACREALDMKEMLVIECHRCPPYARWEVMLNDDGSVNAMFPKAASRETKAKFLRK